MVHDWLDVAQTEIRELRGSWNAVIDLASVPIRPIKPRIILTLLGSVGSGMCLLLLGWLVNGSPPGESAAHEEPDEPNKPVGGLLSKVAQPVA